MVKPMTIWGETKGATDHLASSVADFVNKLFVGRFKLRCDNEPSIMAVAEKVKAKIPDKVVADRTPRHSTVSNGLAERAVGKIGEQLSTLRYDTQNRYKTRISPDSAIWPWMVRYAGFCVTKYVRGAGGVTPFRAAYARDYTQFFVPFAETVLFKTLAPEHRGLSSGKTLQKREGEQKLHCCSRCRECPETCVVGDAGST